MHRTKTITPSHISCTFCGESFHPSASHDCADRIFDLLNTLALDKDDSFSFNQIENLVFQGGGVKGVAYLGVLQQLMIENPEFLTNVKKIAGTSAGSLLALYLGLNMNFEEISELMNLDYAELLDADIKLRVCTNPTMPKFMQTFVEVSVKNIFLTTTKHLENLQNKLKDQKNLSEVQKEISAMGINIVRYFSVYEGFIYNAVSRIKATSFSKMTVKWLLQLLGPKATLQAKMPIGFNILAKQIDLAVLIQQPDAEQHEAHIKLASEILLDLSLDKLIDYAFSSAIDILKGEAKSAETTQMRESQDSQEKCRLSLPSAMLSPALLGSMRGSKQGVHMQKEPELQGDLLHHSIAQLIWFLIVDQKDSNGQKTNVSFFTARHIKEQLIEAPIKKKLAQYGIFTTDPTFADIASCKDADQKPCFRNFYVTAFNTSLVRTEVFSVEHTPNVVVADAVRASMAIPVFFSSVTIRENGTARKVYYDKGKKSEDVHYLDGGMFDNYPLWIFDDLKYCLQDTLQTNWTPKERISIQNPRTLGFKLIDNQRMTKFLKPYFDEENTKLKKVSDSKYNGTFGGLMGLLLKAEVTEHEKSDFINQGNYQRTVYVDSLDVSSVSFNLTAKQKKDLIEAGRNAVLQFKDRARNNFEGEGQVYH